MSLVTLCPFRLPCSRRVHAWRRSCPSPGRCGDTGGDRREHSSPANARHSSVPARADFRPRLCHGSNQSGNRQLFPRFRPSGAGRASCRSHGGCCSNTAHRFLGDARIGGVFCLPPGACGAAARVPPDQMGGRLLSSAYSGWRPPHRCLGHSADRPAPSHHFPVPFARRRRREVSAWVGSESSDINPTRSACLPHPVLAKIRARCVFTVLALNFRNPP